MARSRLFAVEMKQGLKQCLFCCVYGPAEAVPLLQSDSSPIFQQPANSLNREFLNKL
jgi:hypothetical protein